MGHFTALLAELQIVAGLVIVVAGIVVMVWSLRGGHHKAVPAVAGLLIGLFLIGMGTGQREVSLESWLANTFSP